MNVLPHIAIAMVWGKHGSPEHYILIDGAPVGKAISQMHQAMAVASWLAESEDALREVYGPSPIMKGRT